MAIVYITEYKDIYKENLPPYWKIYHYTSNCSSLINNPKRNCTRIVEKNEDELEKEGYTCCSNCISAGFDRGLFKEGNDDEIYFPDDEDLKTLRELKIIK